MSTIWNPFGAFDQSARAWNPDDTSFCGAGGRDKAAAKKKKKSVDNGNHALTITKQPRAKRTGSGEKSITDASSSSDAKVDDPPKSSWFASIFSFGSSKPKPKEDDTSSVKKEDPPSEEAKDLPISDGAPAAEDSKPKEPLPPPNEAPPNEPSTTEPGTAEDNKAADAVDGKGAASADAASEVANALPSGDAAIAAASAVSAGGMAGMVAVNAPEGADVAATEGATGAAPGEEAAEGALEAEETALEGALEADLAGALGSMGLEAEEEHEDANSEDDEVSSINSSDVDELELALDGVGDSGHEALLGAYEKIAPMEEEELAQFNAAYEAKKEADDAEQGPMKLRTQKSLTVGGVDFTGAVAKEKKEARYNARKLVKHRHNKKLESNVVDVAELAEGQEHEVLVLESHEERVLKLKAVDEEEDDVDDGPPIPADEQLRKDEAKRVMREQVSKEEKKLHKAENARRELQAEDVMESLETMKNKALADQGPPPDDDDDGEEDEQKPVVEDKAEEGQKSMVVLEFATEEERMNHQYQQEIDRLTTKIKASMGKAKQETRPDIVHTALSNVAKFYDDEAGKEALTLRQVEAIKVKARRLRDDTEADMNNPEES